MSFLDAPSRAALFAPPENYEEALARYALSAEEGAFAKRIAGRIIALRHRPRSDLRTTRRADCRKRQYGCHRTALGRDITAESFDRRGLVPPCVILKKLAASPRQNRLNQALREMGRIERSIFICDWLLDNKLRRRSYAILNKGESRYALARAVFLHQLGELRNRIAETMAYRASGPQPRGQCHHLVEHRLSQPCRRLCSRSGHRYPG